MPPINKITLTREIIETGQIHRLIQDGNYGVTFISDEERRNSLRKMFDNKDITEDVWLFGYGSLIWNPAINFSERAPMVVCGYHRKFCLETYMGRGSKDAPGLMLGLDVGGSCRGMGYKLSPDQAFQELEIIWKREMVTESYLPRWLFAKTGGKNVRAIGFIVNRNTDRYVGKIDENKVAQYIAQASGFLGTCLEYLDNTADHLTQSGMPDKYLNRIQALAKKLKLKQTAGYSQR